MLLKQTTQAESLATAVGVVVDVVAGGGYGGDPGVAFSQCVLHNWLLTSLSSLIPLPLPSPSPRPTLK